MALRVGFIGWRGMVGSVLMQRMRECGDFAGLEPTFFSTSAAGGQGPTVDGKRYPLSDAFDIAALKAQPVLMSCQGSEYTSEIYPRLRSEGWNGYFIDAARTLRMQDDTVLICDPINRAAIDRGLRAGIKTYAGPNCTVSLMLMGVHGLIDAGHVEWISSMTYQAASGAGAQNMRELIAQMASIGDAARALLDDPAATALDIDARVTETLRGDGLAEAALRRAARRQRDPVDRQADRRRPDAGRVEGPRRGQQDPRARNAGSDRRPVRARRRDALATRRV